MTCEQALELLSAWLDGELDPVQKEALEAHLEACPECRALADTLRGLDDQLAGLREPAPQSLKQGVLYKIDQATGKAKKPRRRWFGPGTAVGAVAAVLVLLVGVGVIPLKTPDKAAASKPAAMDTATRTEASLEDAQMPETAEDNKHSFYYQPNGKDQEGDYAASPIQPSTLPSAVIGNEPAQENEGPEDIEPDTWYRGGNASGEENPQPVTDKVRESCASLSKEEDAAVLLYTEFDFKSLFGLLEAEQPELYALVEKLEPEERDGMIVFETDCGTALAVHEWLLEHLPRSEFMDGSTEEAETSLRMRMEELDPGSGSLYKVVTWAPPDHAVSWPEEWPAGWAIRIRTEENWKLFFPSEKYTPNSDKTAYLAFVP